MNPTVSVIMPAWNAAATVEATIETLLAQSYTDFELLAVDDGSTDDTAARIASLARGERRIRLLRNHRAKGVSGARNTGIAEARGRLLATADADDLYRPRRLELQVAYLDAHPEIMLLGGGFESFTPEGRRWERRHPSSPTELGWRFVTTTYVAHPTLIVRREIHDRYGGYPEDIPMAVDFAFLSRVVPWQRMANLPEILVDYRVRPDSVSHGDPETLTRIVTRQFMENFASYNCAAATAERFRAYCRGARLRLSELAPMHAANARIMRTLRRRYALSRRDPDWLRWWRKLIVGYARLRAPLLDPETGES